MIELSVVIITLNEEKNLARCLESVKKIADEILVVDSCSTDNTVNIATGYGAKIISQPFLGYVEQKIFATDKATYDWVLSIDADEVISPSLEKSILQVKNAPQFNAYEISRITNYCGKWIKHCGWYPDTITRLLNRTKGNWQGQNIHEHWEFTGTETLGRLQGDLLHYSFHSVSDHIKQIEKFTELTARTSVENGKDCSLFKIWLGPKWQFFSMYILRLGILDGYYGYLVCKYSAFASLIKYTKVRQYAARKREGKPY